MPRNSFAGPVETLGPPSARRKKSPAPAPANAVDEPDAPPLLSRPLRDEGELDLSVQQWPGNGRFRRFRTSTHDGCVNDVCGRGLTLEQVAEWEARSALFDVVIWDQDGYALAIVRGPHSFDADDDHPRDKVEIVYLDDRLRPRPEGGAR